MRPPTIQKSNSFYLYFTLLKLTLLVGAGISAVSGFADPKLFGQKLFRVMIDPGHGGADEGTVFHQHGVRFAEKNITLQLALEVSKQLRARGFFVYLTRRGDQEVPLPARTAMANRWGADAFISIHTNSTRNITSRNAEGVETYILNNATDASSKRLARLENSVISQDPPGSPEQMDVALILKDLRLDANVSESKRLACSVQGRLVAATSSPSSPPSVRNRGVKQALFHVLLGADMPSILVEAGFLSNARDRALLLSPRGRQMISHAVAEALDSYRQNKTASLKQNVISFNRCKVN